MNSGQSPTDFQETPCQKSSGASQPSIPLFPLQQDSSVDTSSGSETATESVKFYSDKETVSPKIVIGYHTFGQVEDGFALSVAKAVRYCGSFISHVYSWSGPYVVEARNHLIKHLIETGQHAMLMIDADEEFLPECVLKTWAVATLTGADIVWGNYALGDFRNSIFQPATKKMQKDGFIIPGVMFDLEPNLIIEGVVAGGTGWLYVTRDAALKIKEAYKDDPWPWFNRDVMQLRKGDIHKNSLVNEALQCRGGEDVTFGLRAWKIGLKQVGYTGLVMDHIKRKKTAPAFMAPYIQAHGIGQDILYGKTVKPEKKKRKSKKEKVNEVSEDSTQSSGKADGHTGSGEVGGAVERKE